MAHLPARLPHDEASLADWMVYADELQRDGDPHGVELAHELSLGPDATKKQLREFARRSRGFSPNAQLDLAWVLGHVREARLTPRYFTWIDEGAVRNLVRERFQSSMSRFESVHLVGRLYSDRKQIMTELTYLPESCTRMVKSTPGAFLSDTFDAADFVSELPTRFTHLVLDETNVIHPEVLISDRFERVELPYPPPGIDAALATTRVRVVVDTLPPGTHERVEVRDGPGFVQPDGRAIALPSASLFQLQSEVGGAVPIRVQLAHALPERMYVSEKRGQLRRATQPGIILDRTGDRWMMETGTGTIVDDVEYERGRNVELHDGARVRIGKANATFYTHDLVNRARAARS
ncbi:MAG: hypothetical protein QM831_01685 [Kofleriaceae bacterium]